MPMLTLERSTREHVEAEREIMNTNVDYNMISKNKKKLTTEEILAEIEQAEKIGAHRYLIKEGQQYIGILEYLLFNPKDQCTWLGLLVIRYNLHSQGYGTRVLNLFCDLMKERGIDKFRLGVIAENERGHRFWQKHGFTEVKKVVNEDKQTIVIYEKSFIYI